jgi:hypothetical protein
MGSTVLWTLLLVIVRGGRCGEKALMEEENANAMRKVDVNLYILNRMYWRQCTDEDYAKRFAMVVTI